MKKIKIILTVLTGVGALTIVVSSFMIVSSIPLLAVEEGIVAVSEPVLQWGFAAAAIAAGLSAVAAGYAVAHVGSAAIGALAEKPELFGRIIILVGLAEGIAIYGLIVAILILNRAG